MILAMLYFMVPVYCANMAPVFAKKSFCSLGVPIDNNAQFLGKPLLGSHKTWRGFIVAILMGVLIFKIQQILGIDSIIDYGEYSIFLGILMGAGAIIGDMIGSFIKRRVGIRSGSPLPLVDQLDFVLGGLFFASFLVPLSLQAWIIAVLISPVLTIGVNHLGWYYGIRTERW